MAEHARGLERKLNRYKVAVEKLCEGMAPNCDCLRCRKVREVQASLERSE